MSTGPEKFLVAAVPQEIEQGQQFSELPLHMRYKGWISLDRRYQSELEHKLTGWFMHQPVIGPLTTDKIVDGLNARTMKGAVDSGPWYGLYHFMRSFGSVDHADERFIHNTTKPMLVAPESEVIVKGMPIQFEHVALLSLREVSGAGLMSQVERVVTLGDESRDDQETA